MAKSLFMLGWNSAGTVTREEDDPINCKALVPVYCRGEVDITLEPRSPISIRSVSTGREGVALGNASHTTCSTECQYTQVMS